MILLIFRVSLAATDEKELFFRFIGKRAFNSGADENRYVTERVFVLRGKKQVKTEIRRFKEAVTELKIYRRFGLQPKSDDIIRILNKGGGPFLSFSIVAWVKGVTRLFRY
ncbi:MAG: hypothetical protein MRY79_01880 [Alphaproteobacteria bacterium]|nr:hypothetical protein [Alphaproteobacteria bacterium]